MKREPEQLFGTKPNLRFGSWITPSPISNGTYLRLGDRTSCGSMKLSARCCRKSERPSMVCWPINVGARHAHPSANARFRLGKRAMEHCLLERHRRKGGATSVRASIYTSILDLVYIIQR